jgi:hypothetical protein
MTDYINSGAILHVCVNMVYYCHEKMFFGHCQVSG